MSREDHILKKINLKKTGLELGPLHAPMVKKSDGDIHYLDHATREELLVKYAESNKHVKDTVALDKIVAVDFVLKDSIKKTVGGKKFDYVVASHVIEHIPDTVSWLKDIASVLKPGGLLTLAIPDKRFTFDVTRNTSRPADLIGAYVDKLSRPYSSTVYDHTVEFRKIDRVEAWNHNDRDFSKRPPVNTISQAYEKCLENVDPKIFVDVHCHTYTPASFVKILEALINHDLLDYKVAYFHPTDPSDMEFHVSLKKSEASKAQKLASLPNLKYPKTEQQLSAQVVRLEKQNTELAAQLKHLENSKSWQLTKPLRSVVGAVNKIRSR
ncbi:MAG: class I SAM-dependent methyltransferase [Candidatus Saccharimonadales bacterium]